MNELAREEYAALRKTIRHRGTTRIVLSVVSLIAWAAITIAMLATLSLPVASLVPLVVLAGAFEAIYALHMGVERIGRYLQAFYEPDETDASAPIRDLPAWETAAMRLGREMPAGPDPLFTVIFGLAVLLNFVPVILAGPAPSELFVVGGLHLIVAARLVSARLAAGRQRAADFERFRRMRGERGGVRSRPIGS